MITEADTQLEEAMQEFADEHRGMESNVSPNPNCQVLVDGVPHDQPGQSLVQIEGGFSYVFGKAARLRFNVWVCAEHYAELMAE